MSTTVQKSFKLDYSSGEAIEKCTKIRCPAGADTGLFELSQGGGGGETWSVNWQDFTDSFCLHYLAEADWPVPVDSVYTVTWETLEEIMENVPVFALKNRVSHYSLRMRTCVNFLSSLSKSMAG